MPSYMTLSTDSDIEDTGGSSQNPEEAIDDSEVHSPINEPSVSQPSTPPQTFKAPVISSSTGSQDIRSSCDSTSEALSPERISGEAGSADESGSNKRGRHSTDSPPGLKRKLSEAREKLKSVMGRSDKRSPEDDGIGSTNPLKNLFRFKSKERDSPSSQQKPPP